MSAARAAFAPAKVNLFLHVGPPAADGYHPLVSLMAFADVGDRVEAVSGEGLGLEVAGEFAAGLAGEDPASNLVWRAVQALLARTGARPSSLRLRLDKALPVAAGLGGGSSDAGAALKLVRARLALDVDDAALAEIAGRMGADGPACLAARPVLATGRGDMLSPAPETPPLPAVLVNPRTPCPTGAVYGRFDAMAPGRAGADPPRLPPRFETAVAVAEAMAACRNDLEAPAIAIAPVIADALALLRSWPQTLLARLSGSGASTYALCASEAEAARLAAGVAAARPHWWVRACRLGGPWDA